MENRGWIKLHRSMFDNELWRSEPFTKGQAWIDMIGNANHKPGSVWIRGVEIGVKRGQLAWSELTMSKRWGWSRAKVRRYLGMLKTRQMIEQQKDNYTSLTSICNYGIYQDSDTPNETAGDTPNETAGDTPNEHQTIHKQECKNEKNKDLPKNRAAVLDYSTWPETPDQQILADWKALRKNLKAPVSQTVVARFGKQLSKARDLGFSVDDCLGKVIEKGWKGFSAEWMANDSQQSFGGQQAKRTIRDFPQG